jgi:uncharacterized membrane protein YccC
VLLVVGYCSFDRLLDRLLAGLLGCVFVFVLICLVPNWFIGCV